MGKKHLSYFIEQAKKTTDQDDDDNEEVLSGGLKPKQHYKVEGGYGPFSSREEFLEKLEETGIDLKEANPRFTSMHGALLTHKASCGCTKKRKVEAGKVTEEWFPCDRHKKILPKWKITKRQVAPPWEAEMLERKGWKTPKKWIRKAGKKPEKRKGKEKGSQTEEVSVATVTPSFEASGSTASGLSIEAGRYQVGNATANVSIREMNRSRYRERVADGDGKPEINHTQGNQSSGANVTVLITFNLTMPNGKNVTFSFNAVESKGMGKKEFKSVMGPNELNNTTGTFHLSISIHVTVTPPNRDEPVVDKTLHPADKTFTIPKEEA